MATTTGITIETPTIAFLYFNEDLLKKRIWITSRKAP
jgi:hypothetical protein